MRQSGKVRLRVWGEYACFSRPEFKVERVSYPVITPSAARGVLEAVFWKPEFRFEIRRIGILKQGSQTVILRNELADRQGSKPFAIEDKDRRQQRSSLILKDVEYLIEAEAVLRPHATDPIDKYLDQFNRKVEKGQYHHTPCLGTREFAANFASVNGEVPPPLDLHIGTMLFDIAFVESSSRVELSFRRPSQNVPINGYAQAVFFDASIHKGWIDLPPEKHRELYQLESSHV